MENRAKIREWILQKKDIKRIKGFNPQSIAKDLGISENEVLKHCCEMVNIDKILKFKYMYYCECGFTGIYKTISEVKGECHWCDRTIELIDEIDTEFEFIR